MTLNIDMSQQACLQLEKATQFITQALQHEVVRNRELCLVICRLEEREAEQVEFIHQLKQKIDELQKHLEQKDVSLSKAYETVTFLTTELKDLHLQLRLTNPSSPFKSGRLTSVDESMVSPVAQSPLVLSDQHSPPVSIIAEGPLVLSDQHSPPVSIIAEGPLVLSDQHSPPVSIIAEGPLDLFEAQRLLVFSDSERLVEAHLSGIKTEAAFEDDEYVHGGCSQSAALKSNLKTEQTISSDTDTKAELIQELEAESNTTAPVSLAELKRVSVLLVDCCKQRQQGKNEDDNSKDGELKEIGNGSTPSSMELSESLSVTHTQTERCEKFSCSVCGKSFQSRSQLKSHRYHHRRKGNFSCSQCGKTCSHKSDLKKHMRVHTGEKPYHCTQCDKSFSQKGSLNVHLVSHTGEKPYHCTLCDKSFSQKGSLNVHLLRHTGEKKYSCALCGKSFSRSSSLKAHYNSHTEETPYHCAQCGQSFHEETHLLEHQCSLTGDGPHGSTQHSARQKGQRTLTGERPHQCLQCDKRFSTKSYLNVHLRVHTGERPYCCSVCGKAFSQLANLKAHQFTHTKERPYNCTQCGKGFLRPVHLKQHKCTHAGETGNAVDSVERVSEESAKTASETEFNSGSDAL